MKRPKKVKIPTQKYVLARLQEEYVSENPFDSPLPAWYASDFQGILKRVYSLLTQGCVFTLKDEDTLIVRKPGTSHEGRIYMDDYYDYIVNTIIDIVYPVLE